MPRPDHAAPSPLRLERRDPFAGAQLVAVLDARAVAGLERVGPDGTYLRTLRLPGGPGVVVLRPGAVGRVGGELRLADPGDRDVAIARIRHLLDLDADPVTVDAQLAEDPVLAPLVRERPGLRILGAVDGFELALRAVIGQQVSVAAARTVLGRVVFAHGESLPAGLDPAPGADRAADVGSGSRDVDVGRPVPLRLLPRPEDVATLPDEALSMPRSRAATVRRLAAAVAGGEVDVHHGADVPSSVAALLALPGIGPWTAGYVAMRALGDRDVFPAGDLVLRQSAAALGLPSDARGLAAHAERWAPWRAYAAQHLWAAAAARRATG